MPGPRVSVIIPTYNREHMVIEAIQSVLNQTFQDFELIVVDDGSTDDTSVKMLPYTACLTYHIQKNRGVAAARNAGIRLSKGEFICFLDSDDLWEPTKLETQVHFADAHPEYALISTEIHGFDAGKKSFGRSKSTMYEIRNGFVAEHLLFGNWIQTSTVMLRRRCLDEVGWFDEDVGQFGEDWLLWMRVACTFPIYFLPQSLVSYRFHAGRLTLYRQEEQFEALMKCLRKLSALSTFQQRPDLLREAEYRICIHRGASNLFAGEYEHARIKFHRARKLRTLPFKPAYFLLRTAIEKTIRRRSPAQTHG